MATMKLRNLRLRHGVWWVDIFRDGRRYRRSLKTSDLKEAIFLRDEVVDLFDGTRPLHEPLDDALAQWLRLKRYAPTTVRNVQKALQEWRTFLEGRGKPWRAESWTPDSAVAFKLSLAGQHVSTANWKLSALRQASKYLIGHRVLRAEKNPFDGLSFEKVRTPRREKERALTDAEIRTLLAHATGHKDYDLVMFLLLVGCRLSEPFQLRESRLDRVNRTVEFGGTGSKTESGERVLPLASLAWAIVERHYACDFMEQGRVPWSGRSTSAGRRLRALLKDAGLAEKVEGRRRGLVNVHSLRRTFVRLAREQRVYPPLVSHYTGHAYDNPSFSMYGAESAPPLEDLRSVGAAVQAAVEKITVL